jgi:hypothetical protein
MASNHCKIESSACISRLIARSGQFSGDKTKYIALPRAANPNLQAIFSTKDCCIVCVYELPACNNSMAPGDFFRLDS